MVYMYIYIISLCALGYQPPLKNTTHLFPSPSHICKLSKPSLSGNLLNIDFLWTPPLIVRYFSGCPKYQSFSSSTPSYLLKVTKFLVKISQFEFLVMTEKNIFVYKLFLSLSPWRLSHWSPLKPPPFFENLVGGSTPPSRKGCSHYECTIVGPKNHT